jgi:hypothetical protein
MGYIGLRDFFAETFCQPTICMQARIKNQVFSGSFFGKKNHRRII